MAPRYGSRKWQAVVAAVVGAAALGGVAAYPAWAEVTRPHPADGPVPPVTVAPSSAQPLDGAQTAVTLPVPGPPPIVLPPLPVPLPGLPRPLNPVPPRAEPPSPTSGSVPAPSSSASVSGAMEPAATQAPSPRPPASHAAPTAASRPPEDARSEARSVVAPPPPLAQEAARAVRQFSFPLVLTALMVGFLILQTLVDRRDPKLAASPMIDELHVFR